MKKGLLSALFFLLLSSSALPQATPGQQCVASATASGTGDVITIPALPCALSTNLLIVATTSTNLTTTPTLQPFGLTPQVIVRANGTALGVGDLVAGGRALLNPTGSQWILLNPASLIASEVTGPTTTTVGDLALWGNLTGNVLTDATLTASAKAALGIAVGSAGGVVTLNGAGGTPSSITLTNGTGLPVSTGISGLGASVAGMLATATGISGGSVKLNSSATVPQANITQHAASTTIVSGASAPPASTSVYAMQGLAGTVTPLASGTVLITISGTVQDTSSTTAGDGIDYQISYGTGTAPVNTGTLAGTQVGVVQAYTNPATVTAADVNIPFSTSFVVTGLTVGTAYWIDLAAKAIATASKIELSNISVVAVEI